MLLFFLYFSSCPKLKCTHMHCLNKKCINTICSKVRYIYVIFFRCFLLNILAHVFGKMKCCYKKAIFWNIDFLEHFFFCSSCKIIKSILWNCFSCTQFSLLFWLLFCEYADVCLVFSRFRRLLCSDGGPLIHKHSLNQH